MTYVVTESCIGCRYTECVEVCPVDCFYEGVNFLAINALECIDCGLCESECPVDAIVSEAELSEDRLHLIELNTTLALGWQKITQRKDPLPDADKWAKIDDKIQFLIR